MRAGTVGADRVRRPTGRSVRSAPLLVPEFRQCSFRRSSRARCRTGPANTNRRLAGPSWMPSSVRVRRRRALFDRLTHMSVRSYIRRGQLGAAAESRHETSTVVSPHRPVARHYVLDRLDHYRLQQRSERQGCEGAPFDGEHSEGHRKRFDSWLRARRCGRSEAGIRCLGG